ncbi:competence protein ComA [Desulfosporosinus sp. SB140]|uniref:competence protein ComA n=1 Tax=Desulfosporosinus paludis TaxID=3115649 RepID=UPI00388E70C9
MSRESVIYEVTDHEIRVFKSPLPLFRNFKLKSEAAEVQFDRIPIFGVVEQGVVRDEEALFEILTNYCSEHSCKNHQAYLAIPLQTGIVRSFVIPWLSKRNRRSAISLLTAEEMPSQSDIIYDYFVLAEEKHQNLKVLLGAVRRSLLERYIIIFKRANIEIVGINFSLAILGQSLGFESNEDVLYLQGESEGLQLAIFRGIIPENMRRLRSARESHFPPHDEQGQVSLDKPLEEWENEIRRFLVYHRTQHPDLNFQRLVWNGDSSVQSVAQALLRSNLVSAVEKAELKSVPEAWKKVLEDYEGGSEVAVGYGILAFSHRPVLNLWRQRKREQTVERRYQVLAFVLCGLFLLGNIVWYSLYLKSSFLEKEVVELAKQGERIEAEIKYQNDLGTAWNNVKIHSEKIGEDLSQVQALSGPELEIGQIVFKQGTMFLHGRAKNARSIETLITTLKVMGWDEPALSSYQLTSLNSIEFSLNTKRAKKERD